MTEEKRADMRITALNVNGGIIELMQNDAPLE